MFPWTRFMQLWPPFCKLSQQNPKVFLSISENDINYIFFKLNFLSSKSFLQTRIMQFWQPCQKIVPEARKFFAQFPKKIKKINLPQQKSVKMLSWMRRMQYWQLCRNVSDKKPNYFRWMSENDIKNNSLEFCFFLITFLWSRIMQFWQPCQKNCARSPKFFRSVSEKDKKFNFLQQKTFQMSRMRRMQYWQPCRNFFSSMSQNDEKLTFFKKVLTVPIDT